MSLVADPLTREGFAPFGQVIEAMGQGRAINQGTTVRFHDLAHIDLPGGGPLVSIFRGQPRPTPISIRMLERHPLGSQAFVPLQNRDWLIVVAHGSKEPAPETLRAFRASGRQGVNYARNVWHHPLLTLYPDGEFLVIDRGGDEGNLEEHWFPEGLDIRLAADG